MGRVLAALVMLCVATLASAVYADPTVAADKPMALDFEGEQISAAYIYPKRDLVEAMAKHYCRHVYGKEAALGPGACTKMLPLEANRCRAQAVCR